MQINQFLAHHLEIIQKALLAHLVLAGDISLAERHQVVDVIASSHGDKLSDRWQQSPRHWLSVR